jgi:signal transduction histidine kinase
MRLSWETVRALAPSSLENQRVQRYHADEQALALDAFPETDRPVLVETYAALGALEALVAQELVDPEPLLALLAERDFDGLFRRIRTLGASRPSERVAAALHDVRGGALTALFVHLARVGRAASLPEVGRALFIAARDHRKVMRNVVLDLDPAARARDLATKPHSLADLARAIGEFSGGPDEARIRVEVTSEADGVVAESCVECAAVDRVAYNLLNNAARHAADPVVEAWLAKGSTDLRVVVANGLADADRAALEPIVGVDPARLFSGFSTTGSGHGLRIVSELVGQAYGVASVATLVREGYVGATTLEETFVAWFHWPLSGA